MPGWTRRLRELRRKALALYQDRRTPWYAKLAAGAVVAYALSPIDLIPDFIPVVGLRDDLVLVPLGVVMVRRLVPPQVMESCRGQAEALIAGGKPVSRAGVVLIVAVWCGLVYLTYRAILAWL